jgi:hypothetical protein
MAEPSLYPRFVQPHLEEALADTPVVLIHGPRQCGKTTLARPHPHPVGNDVRVPGDILWQRCRQPAPNPTEPYNQTFHKDPWEITMAC